MNIHVAKWDVTAPRTGAVGRDEGQIKNIRLDAENLILVHRVWSCAGP